MLAELKSLSGASLEYALIEDRAQRRKLKASISGSLVPAVEQALGEAKGEEDAGAEATESQEAIARIEKNWQRYLERYGPARFAADLDGEQAAAEKIKTLLDRLIADADLIAEDEAEEAAKAIEATGAFADSLRVGLITATAITLLIALGIALLLTRRLVLRTREYSRFAAAVATGSFGERLELRGNDEQVPAVKRDITISVGVATAPDHGVDVDIVLRVADRALYTAKEAGRNRVELAAVRRSGRARPPPVDAEPALP